VLGTMRDTSKDYRTYWIRNGEWYGKAGNLGAMEACRIPPGILKQIPEPDRQLIIEEANADSRFCRELVNIAGRPGWEHEISRSAKCAILNEIDPSKCKDSAGKWGRLRAKFQNLVKDVPAQIERAVAAMPLAEKLAVVRRIAAGQSLVPAVSGLGELGQWDIIGSLVGNVATAGANIYTAKITTDAQRDIAKLQATAAMRDAQTQMALQSAQASIGAAKTAQAGMFGPISSMASASIGGIPLMIVIPVAGLLLYFVLKK